MTKRVGFDRIVRAEWLDAIAGKVKEESDANTVREYLHAFLKADHPSYEARRKTVTVLMRIWFAIPEDHVDLRERALQQISDLDSKERLWLHWGMSLLAFPFFRDVVSNVGRLLSLQGEFSVSQVSRKVEETWGSRTTAARAVPRVIHSLREWDVIAKTKRKGIYAQPSRTSTRSIDVETWFVEALLKAEKIDSIPLEQIDGMHSAFPFSLSLTASHLFESSNLEIDREGPSTVIRAKP